TLGVYCLTFLNQITRTEGLLSYTRLNSSNFSVNPPSGVCVDTVLLHRHRSLPQSSSSSRFTAGASRFSFPPPSCSPGISLLHFRPPPVDFCSSRLAIGAATERARALAMPAGTRAQALQTRL